MTVLALQIFTDWMEADGVQIDWPYDFTALRETDVRLSVRDPDGEVTVYENLFAFLPNANFQGGYIRYPVAATPLAAGWQVRVNRQMVLEQATDIGAEGSFNPELHEQLFDKLTMMLQEVYELAARSLHMPFGTPGYEVPLPAANSFIGWNSAGTGLENKVIVVSSEVFPAAPLTYLRRNSDNTAWDALTAAEVKDHLGLVPGTDIQPFHINLQILSDMTLGTAGLAILMEPRYAREEDISRTSETTQPVIPKSLRELVGIAEDALALGQASATGTSTRGFLSPPATYLSIVNTVPSDMEIGDTFDGQILALNDICAIAVPGGHINNGFWQVQAVGPAIRLASMDTAAEICQKLFTISAGTYVGQTWFVATTLVSGAVLDTDPFEIIYIKGPEGYEGEVIAARQGELDLETRIEAATGRVVSTKAMPNSSVYVEDGAGNVACIATSVHHDEVRNAITANGFRVILKDRANEEGLRLEDNAGNGQIVGGGGSGASTQVMGVAPLFDEPKIAAADVVGYTESKRLMGRDLDWAPTLLDGVNAIGWEGQSFMGMDSGTNVFDVEALLTKLGLADQAFSVGAEERCVKGVGFSTFITFGGDTRVLSPLRQHVIAPTGTDLIYSSGDVAIGNFPLNARTGSLGPVALFVFAYLNMKFFEQTSLNSSQKFYSGNKAKNEGSLAEILTGDGLSRAKDWARVYLEAAALVGNGHSALARQFLAWCMNHGQHDEQEPPTGSADYRGEWRTARADIWTDLQAKQMAAGHPQVKRPPWLISQVASYYGLDTLKCAKEQLAAGNDLVDDFDVLLVACDSELPSYGNMPEVLGTNPPATTFPESGNPHPNWIGAMLQSIRYGIALHEIFVKRIGYFIPFNFKFYRDGDKALFVLPNMSGNGMRVAALPNGNDVILPKHLGYSVRTSSGSEVPIIGIRPAFGSNYCVEAQLAADPGAGAYLVAGGRTTGHTAQVFLRDNYNIELPWLPEFTNRLKVFGNRWFGGQDYLDSNNPEADPGVGYVDNPETNGIGRYVAQVPGFYDKPFDLGNPCARSIVTSEALP